MVLHDLIRFWQRRFLAATIAVTVGASGYVMLVRHEQNARETAAALERMDGTLVQIRAATAALEQTLAAYRALLPPGYAGRSDAALLFERLDDLKSEFPGAQLTIAALADQSDSVALPFTVRVTTGDYTAFVNTLARLQSRLFPFVSVMRVAIDYDQPTTAHLAFTLEGVIMTPKHDRTAGLP